LEGRSTKYRAEIDKQKRKDKESLSAFFSDKLNWVEFKAKIDEEKRKKEEKRLLKLAKKK